MRIQCVLLVIFFVTGTLLGYRIEFLKGVCFGIERVIVLINEREAYEQSRLYSRYRRDWKKHVYVGLPAKEIRSREGEPDDITCSSILAKSWMPECDSMWMYSNSDNAYVFFKSGKCIGVRNAYGPFIFSCADLTTNLTRNVLELSRHQILSSI